MMNALTRCEGAYIGHAIASQYDPSIYMSLNVSDSLLACQKFDGPDILSRHLYLYHTQRYEIGETTKYIYQEALVRIGTRTSPTRENFLFKQSCIDEMVQIAHKKCDGLTAGCGPAHRSYPLAFCHFISDDDLYEYSTLEAQLTHYSPLAGQVAGIVNVICRSLLKNKSWDDAVNLAFSAPRLHKDVQQIYGRHHRWSNPAVETHAAYAPTVLNNALHHVAASKNASQAMAKADGKEKFYSLPIVGVLAGAYWGISAELFKDNIDDSKLKRLRDAAAKLSSFWKEDNGHAQA
ncbi:unnamed protein product [Rotaria magnacalcarata]|uniref:Uncharacterized protein n=1 Tax=Rotaria magnacalcarata TaxID=392030 RepID=A0A819F9K5_9BILA|nr:unnamed protein product [Rotaria magnacalcarata]CAF3864835.1 unnamed protein product [Rotaria magnacalcarata]